MADNKDELVQRAKLAEQVGLLLLFTLLALIRRHPQTSWSFAVCAPLYSH